MTDLNEIRETLKENERIANIFHQVESKILSILNFRDFFEVLLSEIRERFSVPHVWFSIMGKSELSTMIDALEDADILKDPLSIVEPGAFSELIDDSSKPLLRNGDLEPFAALMDPGGGRSIGSMAIVPILLDGAPMGG